MNSKHIIMTIACAAAFCGSVRADNANDASKTKVAASAVQPSASNLQPDSSWSWAMGEGLSYDETPIAAAEVSLAFDSKFLSYGLVDNNDPILTPGASLTLFDWLTVGVESIFDVTRYGAKHVDGERLYENRQFKYQELDPCVSIDHAFSPDDISWLPTTVEFSLGYAYEYHPRSYSVGQDDTQFVTFEISLPDLWIEPTLAYERDIDRDNGTYVNLELGHTFEISEGLEFRPSVAQGVGNTQRVAGYLSKSNDEPLDHGGLMDTCLKGEFTWTVTDGVTLGAYVAYSDFLFDSKIREAARRYEASGDWTDSWNFIGGLSLTVAF